ncbi:MAG TPA: tetratricopeptide repeat protein, partial [Verrucomicrobiae bacterium]|nr:tetratricopeptide repeat protein [Verrucomicrobiae bacterium]
MRRVRGAGCCGVLVLVLVAAVWTTRAEEGDSRARGAAEGPGSRASSLPASSVTPLGAVLFVWPALEEPLYADADAAPWRDALLRAQRGAVPDAGPRREPRSGAALFLAADLTLLRAARGGGDYEGAATAYERALREAPEFADGARAWFLLGQADLALGFTPEAGAAFRELVRRFPASPLLDDARLGQAAALRLRRRPREARR